MGKEKYKVGDRFNSWTLLKKLGRVRSTVMWRVICDCGKVKDTPAGNISLGKSKACASCGAKKREENYRKNNNHPRKKKTQ